MQRILILMLILSAMACQKAQRDEDDSVNTCEDVFLAQTIFTDAYRQVRYAAQNAKGISDANSTLSTIYGCEEITVDTTGSPRTIIIDYKYIGCEGQDQDRYGRLLADFFGKFGVNGSAVDITFSNYFFGETYEVSGKIRVIFKEDNASGQETHTFYLQEGKVYDGEATLSWTASQNWTVVASGDSETYEITGNSNGVNRKGNTFTSEITKTNVLSDACIYTLSGGKDIDVKNLSLRQLDFGSGSCDGLAEATINGATYGVTHP